MRRLILAAALTLLASGAQAQSSRTIRLVVPYPPAGTADIVARLLADQIGKAGGPSIVIENRPGGSGNVGAGSVIGSPPDGYTVMFVGPNNAISASVFKKLPFDFLRDTAPVGGIMLLTNIMVVPPTLPVKTVAEFIAYGKANPGKLNMASPGAGTSPHLSGELFKMLTGIEMQHIPYRGAGPAYPDLMTGKVDVFFDNLPGSVELVKSGTTEPDADLTKALCAGAHAAGVIVLSCGTYGNVLRLLPPLVMPDHLLEEGLGVLEKAFASLA